MKENEILLIKKKDYFETVRRPYLPFYTSLMFEGSADTKNYKGFFTKPYSRKNTIYLDHIWYYFLPTENLGRKYIIEQWNSEKKLKKVISAFFIREKNILGSVKKDLQYFRKAYCEYMPTLGLTYLAEVFYDRIKALLENKVGKNKASKLLNLLGSPLVDNFYKKEEYDLAKTKNLKKHVKKYEWLLSRYGDDKQYTIEDAKNKLLAINKGRFLKAYSENKAKISSAVFEAKKVLGKKNSFLVDAIQFISFYRTQRTDIMNKTAYLYMPKLKLIAFQKELSYREILFCTIREVVSGKLPTKNEINQRMRGHVVLSTENGAICYTGPVYQKLKKIFKTNNKKIDSFKGSTAYKGFVKGIVRTISDKNDFFKLKNGEILVSSMTTTDMLPIMKKASAFITDEGGITCHAAIVARELKKPCIIGTKIATKVLHDGDIVEIDANNGTTKILKRAQNY